MFFRWNRIWRTPSIKMFFLLYFRSRRKLLETIKNNINHSNFEKLSFGNKFIWLLNSESKDIWICMCDFLLKSHCFGYFITRYFVTLLFCPLHQSGKDLSSFKALQSRLSFLYLQFIWYIMQSPYVLLCLYAPSWGL